MSNLPDTTSSNNAPPLDLREFWNRRKREIKAEINCVSVGTVQAFDATTQTATVSINYRAVIRGGAPLPNGQAADKVVEYPLLLKCPVMMLTGGAAVLTMPITAGDTCIVLYCDRDIDNWFQTGDVSTPPQSGRLHDFSDALAIVGIRSLANHLTSYDANKIKITLGGAYLTIDPSGNVEISSPSTVTIKGATGQVQLT